MSENIDLPRLRNSLRVLADMKRRAPPSMIAKQEVQMYEQEQKKYELVNQDLHNQALKQIIDLRTQYSRYILRFLIGWTTFTAIMIILSSLKFINVTIDPIVLTALVGSCFGNVLALAGVVAKGIFLQKDKVRE